MLSSKTPKWRTIRIFISSTFKDMQAERDHLVRSVFPRLRDEMRRRHFHLVDVDLRWGVAGEVDAAAACLDILDECRPRFLCILGGRYGWTPPGREESITAEEIRHALSISTQEIFAWFYLREPAATASMEEQESGEFREAENSLAARKLNDLKQRILSSEYEVSAYTAFWDREHRRLAGLDAFGEQIYDQVLRSIDAEFGPANSEAIADAEETDAVDSFIEERTAMYIPGDHAEALDVLYAFAHSNDQRRVLLLSGKSGSGKSAMLCHFLNSTLTSSPDLFLAAHFAGTGGSSSSLSHMLYGFCAALSKELGSIEALPQDIDHLKPRFEHLLQQVSKRRRVVLLLDAVNQMEPQGGAHTMTWLPSPLPPGVRIIISTAPYAVEQVIEMRPDAERVELPRVGAHHASAILNGYLKRYQKRLASDQLNALAAKPDAFLPLYLLLTAEELRTQGSFERIHQIIDELPGETAALFLWVLRRLAVDPVFNRLSGDASASTLAERLVCVLAASRAGLSECELRTLCAPSGDFGDLAAILRQLRSYLTQRGELLDFYHAQFRNAVHDAFLAHSEALLRIHTELATFFMPPSPPSSAEDWAQAQPRTLRELLFHLLKARDCRQLSELLHSGFLEAYAQCFGDAAALEQAYGIGEALTAAGDRYWRALVLCAQSYDRIRERLKGNTPDIEEMINDRRIDAVARLIEAQTDKRSTGVFATVAWASFLEIGDIDNADRFFPFAKDYLEAKPAQRILCTALKVGCTKSTETNSEPIETMAEEPAPRWRNNTFLLLWQQIAMIFSSDLSGAFWICVWLAAMFGLYAVLPPSIQALWENRGHTILGYLTLGGIFALAATVIGIEAFIHDAFTNFAMLHSKYLFSRFCEDVDKGSGHCLLLALGRLVRLRRRFPQEPGQDIAQSITHALTRHVEQRALILRSCSGLPSADIATLAARLRITTVTDLSAALGEAASGGRCLCTVGLAQLYGGVLGVSASPRIVAQLLQHDILKDNPVDYKIVGEDLSRMGKRLLCATVLQDLASPPPAGKGHRLRSLFDFSLPKSTVSVQSAWRPSPKYWPPFSCLEIIPVLFLAAIAISSIVFVAILAAYVALVFGAFALSGIILYYVAGNEPAVKDGKMQREQLAGVLLPNSSDAKKKDVHLTPPNDEEQKLLFFQTVIADGDIAAELLARMSSKAKAEAVKELIGFGIVGERVASLLSALSALDTQGLFPAACLAEAIAHDAHQPESMAKRKTFSEQDHTAQWARVRRPPAKAETLLFSAAFSAIITALFGMALFSIEGFELRNFIDAHGWLDLAILTLLATIASCYGHGWVTAVPGFLLLLFLGHEVWIDSWPSQIVTIFGSLLVAAAVYGIRRWFGRGLFYPSHTTMLGVRMAVLCGLLLVPLLLAGGASIYHRVYQRWEDSPNQPDERNVIHDSALFGYSLTVTHFEGKNTRHCEYFDSSDRAVPVGLLVRKVVPGSQAEAARIFPGDVLLSYEGEPMPELCDFVYARHHERLRGPVRKLEILRAGKPIRTTVYPGPIGVELLPVAISKLGIPAPQPSQH